MPLPFILGAAAVISGVVGVKKAVQGVSEMKEAKIIMEGAEASHQYCVEKFDNTSEQTNTVMDELGKIELKILQNFDKFSSTIEKIQNRPQFQEYDKNGIKLPTYDKQELDRVSIGAGVLLGGLGGAALGTAGGFAAAGATTSAVMALGTASTGTAIASLSGAAATNATLAALGGGAVGSGYFAGGMALGTQVLGAATLGVGFLVGGIVFSAAGKSMSNKATKALMEAVKNEQIVDEICEYLDELRNLALKYTESLNTVQQLYEKYFLKLDAVVNINNKRNWNNFTKKEKLATQNAVLLVGLLYKMCKVNLVIKSDNEDEMNKINNTAVEKSIEEAEKIIEEVA